ncbi:MAG TPA: hypothetical protein VGF92_05510 [Stellaceae bacterium]|jgi:hypothetical protein
MTIIPEGFEFETIRELLDKALEALEHAKLIERAIADGDIPPCPTLLARLRREAARFARLAAKKIAP